jgi:hypothetical protein
VEWWREKYHALDWWMFEQYFAKKFNFEHLTIKSFDCDCMSSYVILQIRIIRDNIYYFQNLSTWQTKQNFHFFLQIICELITNYLENFIFLWKLRKSNIIFICVARIWIISNCTHMIFRLWILEFSLRISNLLPCVSLLLIFIAILML